ncbi:MAG: cobalamin-binding protein [Myxococcota bacterium]
MAKEEREETEEDASATVAEAHEALRNHAHVHWQSPERSGDGDGDGAGSFRRIVSLVPSLSEALVSLGMSSRLVGVTSYCVHPEAAFRSLPKLGGTKDADVEAIAETQPDLVIANQEENTARVVRKLADRGIDVWVTYPRTVREGAELLRAIAELGAEPEAIEAVVQPVFQALESAEARATEGRTQRPRVFCPIWRDPWMTIARDTYIHDLIELCGGENVFPEASEGRRYPLVDLAAVERAAPEVILLPDEPYAFAEKDRAELLALDCPAAKDDRVHLIDGTLVSWYGPRIAEAIRALAPIFANS